VRLSRDARVTSNERAAGGATVEARAWARDGSRSRWGALAEQGEAGSGHGRAPCPASADRALSYYPCVGSVGPPVS
jgi:hypothetical protein